MVASLGFSGTVSQETLSFWDQTLKDVYSGDEGRRKLRMALLCLMERDGLVSRLRDIKCPVYWLQVSSKKYTSISGSVTYMWHGLMRTGP